MSAASNTSLSASAALPPRTAARTPPVAPRGALRAYPAPAVPDIRSPNSGLRTPGDDHSPPRRPRRVRPGLLRLESTVLNVRKPPVASESDPTRSTVENDVCPASPIEPRAPAHAPRSLSPDREPESGAGVAESSPGPSVSRVSASARAGPPRCYSRRHRTSHRLASVLAMPHRLVTIPLLHASEVEPTPSSSWT